MNRSSRLLALFPSATCLLTSLAAHAQGVDEFGGYGSRRGVQSESKQEAAFELRLGRYMPEVDSQVSGSPFQNTFGNDARYLLGAEIDWQLLRIPHFGTLAPGLGWGYTRFSAKARFASTGEASGTDTRLSVSCGLTLAEGWNRCDSVAGWRARPAALPDRVPAVFALLA